MCPIEFLEFSQPFAGQLNALALPRKRQRRKLSLETVLLLARKVARTSGKIGIVADPLGSEVTEEIVDIVLLREKRKCK